MSKTYTNLKRHALNGPTMGTRWSALFYMVDAFDPRPVQVALQAAVDEVDAQMSTWKSDSDLMHLNSATIGDWVEIPDRLMDVLRLGLGISCASNDAFDMGMGDVVTAWGFGADVADQHLIRKALNAPRHSARAVLELHPENREIRKTAPIILDLNGIAKGYGVDRLTRTLRTCGISSGLVGIDGEMRALGLQPDDQPWRIAIEAPDADRRVPHSMLALENAAVATSGDYRHWTLVGDRRLSHTMDPQRGAPLMSPPASVTVVARTCAEADAWATALMVLGHEAGGKLARQLGLNALFLLREGEAGLRAHTVGPLFSAARSV